MNPSDHPPHVPTLNVVGATLGYGERTVVRDFDLDVPAGRITVIVGANACGKSTLLRAMGRLLKPSGGVVLLEGRDIHRAPTREVAQRVGVLPQTPIAPEGIVVADLVGHGRNPHRGLLSRWTAADDDAVFAALSATGVADLADRPVDELSGGQRQRVWIAMALAQDTDILLLDEPTTFLDVTHQIDVLDLLTELNRRRGTTIVMVLHDLNLAARYADELVAVKDGGCHRRGTPAEVVTVECVREVFGLESQVIEDPTSGAPLVLPLGQFHVRR